MSGYELVGIIVLVLVVMAGLKWISDNVTINVNTKKRK